MARYFVDGKNDKIEREDLYTVKLIKADGEVIEGLEPKRLFPYTDPDHYVTLIADSKKEKAVIYMRSMKDFVWKHSFIQTRLMSRTLCVR